MEENKTVSTAVDGNYYDNTYLPQINRIGKITGLLGIIVSFAPALVLAVVFGILPPPAAVLTAFISIASAVGILWVVEPLSYFPVVGVAGTYMAFLSGNISNMRVPCAAVAQEAAGVKPGTKEGSIISALGMAVSIVINVSVLTIGVLLGSSLLQSMPPVVMETLNYLLPALFGALLAQFGYKNRKLTSIMLVFAILLNVLINGGFFSWIPGASNYLSMLSSVFLSIVLALNMYKRSKKKAA